MWGDEIHSGVKVREVGEVGTRGDGVMIGGSLEVKVDMSWIFMRIADLA